MIRCTCVKGRLVFRAEENEAQIGSLSVEIFRKAVKYTKKLAKSTQLQVLVSIRLNKEWVLTITHHEGLIVTLRGDFEAESWSIVTIMGVLANNLGEQ